MEHKHERCKQTPACPIAAHSGKIRAEHFAVKARMSSEASAA